jgi:hypothetical protein
MAAEKSKVIHVRSVGQDVTEDDLNQFAQEFGTVTKVVLLRLKNQVSILSCEPQVTAVLC